MMKIKIGLGSCGIAAGALKVYEKFLEYSKDREDIFIEKVGCIGMCYLEPIVDVYDDKDNFKRYTHVQEKDVLNILEENIDLLKENIFTKEDEKIYKSQLHIATERCGFINPESIEEYIENRGYEALEKTLNNMSPLDVIEEIKISNLRGRGGAGFPTWFKWNIANNQKNNEKYIVCNADEGDPGAFMDRSILEGDPHNLLEGMIIAGYAMGAKVGIIYVRAEYPLAIKRLKKAIDDARKRSFLGKNILGKDFSFDIRIKAGAGAFVCGEETALIASLEGERGMPRLKPPFPGVKGYKGKPTNINNVETYANVAWIIRNGGNKFASIGKGASTGTKVFALTGKVKNGGLVEVPMGTSIKEIIYDVGGGISTGKKLKAVQMGGPSGGCIPTELIDTTVDYESLQKTGAIMGSGGMVVMDESTCMVNMAKFFLEFTKKESCGKCIQCRIGTVRMLEILERITEGRGREGDIELLIELGNEIKESSLCGLGQTAPNPVLSTIKYFRDEYEAHIKEKRCPSGECTELINYKILDNCIGCGICKKNCPVSCIDGKNKTKHKINTDICIKCGLCFEICPLDAIVRE